MKTMKNESRKGGKLDIIFPGGPYEIIADLGKGRFRLSGPDGKVLRQTISCHRLKLWLDPEKRKVTQSRRKEMIVYCETYSCFRSFTLYTMIFLQIFCVTGE